MVKLSDEMVKKFKELIDAPMLKLIQEKKHGRNPLGVIEWPEEAYWGD